MKTVLIIEDDEELADGFQCWIRDYGMTSYKAVNGKDAINMIFQIMPDLILCDVQMPGADGYEVLKTLKRDARIAEIPLIFITGQSRPEDLRKGMILGAENYLVKPVSDIELYAAIASCGEKRRRKKEKEELFCKQLTIQIADTLSHELRTPLTGIISLADLLEDLVSKPDTEKDRLIIEIYKNSALRLGQAVERFLLFTQLNASIQNGNKIRVIPSMDDMAPLVFATASRIANDHSRSNDLRFSGSACNEMEDGFLSRLVIELVDNAFKFSRHGTSVEVKIVGGEEKLMLIVKDAGRGMSDEEISSIRVLNQFNRSKNEQQGFGLGFSIIKFITEYFGGRLLINSQLNIGTTISIELPVYSNI